MLYDPLNLQAPSINTPNEIVISPKTYARIKGVRGRKHRKKRQAKKWDKQALKEFYAKML